MIDKSLPCGRKNAGSNTVSAQVGGRAAAAGRRVVHMASAMLLPLATLLLVGRSATAQLQFESPPINYNAATTDDPIAKLQSKIESGEVTLKYDDQHGYLPSVLKNLDIPFSSQMLVFSKTSFQLRRIAPWSPRAVYFGDDTYIGWVQDGEVVEVSTVDPHQGAIFYSLKQQETPTPKFVRDRGQCLSCHASSRTAGVPGHLVRSVYTDRFGFPMLGSRTYKTDHTSPLSQRWGGWYVSGTHGKQQHMGNIIIQAGEEPDTVDLARGANITDLSKLVDVRPYLSPTSDIVALMVVEHQSQMQNYITRASFETRSALHYDQMMNKALERPMSHRSDTTKRRLKAVCDRLVDYMLFVGEYQLEAPIKGVSTFAKEFSAKGLRDSKGRSLRDLDLQHRLMKYPCSYQIYSEAFDALPQPAAEQVYRRLHTVLTGGDQSEKYAHLTADDRQAILEILRDTKPNLPDYWR